MPYNGADILCYVIKLDSDNAMFSPALHALLEQEEVYLSANLRLSGVNKAAMLGDEPTARQFAEAAAPRLAKRYGVPVRFDVQPMTVIDSPKAQSRIQDDSALVLGRLRTQNFAPNVPVKAVGTEGSQ